MPDITDPGDDLDLEFTGLAHEMGLSEDSLALQIDSALDRQVWNGSTFDDRTTYSVGSTARDLVTQMERSLMNQESYDEFHHRMLSNLGVEDSSAKGVLRNWINQVSTEATTAWNQAMIAANQSFDTTLAWEAVLDDRTTQGCWDNHGLLIDEAEGDIPAHFRCRCGWRTIPNPNSDDPDTAAEGQEVVNQMLAEKGEG